MIDPTLAELEAKTAPKAADKPKPAKEAPPPPNPMKLAQDWRDHVKICMQCRDPANPCDWGKEVQAQIPEPLMKEFKAMMGHAQIKSILLDPNLAKK